LHLGTKSVGCGFTQPKSEAKIRRQRLSKTGSFGWGLASGKIYWSRETFRIFEYDLATKPTLELALNRVHPLDRAPVRDVMDRTLREGKDFDLEHRLLMPDDTVKDVQLVGHECLNAV
jgi:hypothetical protein